VKIVVLSPKQVVYEGEVESVFLPGDLAEFELMDHHVPILSLLRKGDIVIDWKLRIPINKGLVKFDKNECTILLEEWAGQGKGRGPSEEPEE